MKRIAVYGSLREGLHNYERCMFGAEFIGEETINGFDMYSLGSYPCIIDGEGDVLFEVYDVPEKTAQYIHDMEVHSGYEAREIATSWGMAEIYVYKRSEHLGMKYTPKVLSGDWKEYYTLQEAQR